MVNDSPDKMGFYRIAALKNFGKLTCNSNLFIVTLQA